MAVPADRKHWSRWSKTAFFLAANAVRGTYPVYFEGDERTTRLDTHFAEVRLTGPDVWEPARECYQLTVIFNVLINTKQDANDLYKVDRMVGQFTDAFTNTISVFRRGNGVDDDQSFFGCYQLTSEIDVNQFGLVDTSLRVIQATIEGTYELTLS